MTHARQQLGLLGERIAARWYRQQGWTLRAHRFRSGHRDIDLIMQQGTLLAFVEVKARLGDRFGSPIEAVHRRKRLELVRSARIWIDRHGDRQWCYRFDVFGVLIIGQNVRIKHLPNAFELS